MNNSQQVVLEVKNIVSPSQAARFLGVSRMTLWRWLKQGKVRAIVFDKQSYFHIKELQQLKEQREGDATP